MSLFRTHNANSAQTDAPNAGTGSASSSPIDRIQRVLRLVKRVMGPGHVEVSLGSSDEISTRFNEQTVFEESAYCPIHDTVVRRNAPIVTKGATGSTASNVVTARFPDAEAILAVPIMISGIAPLGALAIASEGPRTFASADIASLRDFAAVIAEQCSGDEISDVKFTAYPEDAGDEERLLALMENAAEVFVIVDGSFRITYLGGQAFPNRSAAEGMPFSNVIFEPDRAAVLQALEKALLAPAQPISTVAFRVQSGTGAHRWYQCVINNRLNEEAVSGITINCLDITDSRAAEARLIQAKEKAEEMSRLKSTFLTNMGHEIRTPLTGILGFAGILAGELEGEQRSFAQMIEQSGTRLMNILNAILDLARLETDRADLRNEMLDVGKEVGDVVKLMEPAAAAKSLYLRYAPPEGEALARLDRTYLGRVLEQLLSNAIRFTTHGGITVTLRMMQRDIEIAVWDTGEGISASAQRSIFEGFMRETPSENGVKEVGGMGLAICRRLVSLMGGEISLESRKGTGSTFTVTLPRYFAPDAEPEVADVRGLPSTKAEGRRIIVLDDSHMSRVLVQRILESTYTVDMAGTAEEAIRRMCEVQYDLVLLDINLGTEKSGFDVLDELRTLQGYRNTPVVAVTAYALPGDQARFLTSGFDYFLGKPYTKQELLDLVTRILEPA